MMGVCSEMLLGVLMLVFFIHSSFQVARAAGIFFGNLVRINQSGHTINYSSSLSSRNRNYGGIS